MYHEHFGLERSLFDDGIAQDGAVFFAAGQQRAAMTLKVALTSRDSVAVLVGPAGIGKTTIASHTLRAMTTRLALGWLGSAPLTSHELLEMLLTEYGFTPYKHSRVERLQMWRQFLSEMSLTGTRVCILVENADSYTPEVLVALESMTAADPSGCPGANVVLTSRSSLAELFANPVLAPLRQRTRMQHCLGPLDRADLKHYLAHCAEAAGSDHDRIFAPDAADALHGYSGGVIRVANNLCETALTMAADEGLDRLSAELVARTATDVFGIVPLVAPMPAPAAFTPVSLPAPAASTPVPAGPAPKPAAPVPTAAPAAVTSLTATLGPEPQPSSAPPAARQLPAAITMTESKPRSAASSVPTRTAANRAAPPVGAQRPPVTAPSIAIEARRAAPATTPLDVSLEQTDEVPLLTLAVQEDGLNIDLDIGFDLDMEIDLEMGEAQIDDVLRNDVPTLTDSIELADDELDAGTSIRIGLDRNAQDDLENLAAVAHAQALEDISNSMAEKVFGSGSSRNSRQR